MKNSVSLIGRVGNDVKISELENTTAVNFPLATTDFYKNAKGEKIEETQWHTLTAFGKTADNIKKFVHKGDLIAVDGKITYRSYEDKEGIKRYITEIRIKSVSFLSSNRADISDESDDLNQ